MTIEEHELRLARELGGINEKLKGIESKLDEMVGLEGRLRNIEREVDAFKVKAGMMALSVSAFTSLVGWVIIHWNKILKAF